MNAVSNLIQASRVLPGDMIAVYWNSDRPDLGQVNCKVQQRHPESGWRVSHYGSSLMSIGWNYTLQGWCFTPERD